MRGLHLKPICTWKINVMNKILKLWAILEWICISSYANLKNIFKIFFTKLIQIINNWKMYGAFEYCCGQPRALNSKRFRTMS